MSNVSEAKKFYVYAFLRKDGTPYYIGKGSGDRAYTNRNRVFKRPNDHNRIKIVKDSLPEACAFSLEKMLINVHGRKDVGSGILRNLTDGGEGASGRRPTEKTRREKSEAVSGKNHPMYDTQRSKQTCRKISEKLKGRKLPKETCEAMSKSRKGKPRARKLRVHGEEYRSIAAAAKELKIGIYIVLKRVQSAEYPEWNDITEVLK